jgi:hypothetical protein
MTTVAPLAGDREFFRPPDVHHVKQDPVSNPHWVWFWLKYGHAGDAIRVIYRDPTDTVFRDSTITLADYHYRYKDYWSTYLPTTKDFLGTWTIELRLNEVTQALMSFEYDEIPYENPAVETHTVEVDHGVAVGDLRGSDADSGLMEFRLVTPPSHGRVALSGPRQRYFTYTPESGYEGLDTFEVEVEDGQQQISAPATMTMDVSPVIANALRLEGEADYVNVPDNGTLNLTDAFTLEAWIRRTMGSSDGEFLFDRRYTDNTSGYTLAIQGSGVLAVVVGTGSGYAFTQGTTPLPMNEWTHVAATWDGEYLRLYVNGQQEPGEVSFAGPVSYPATYTTRLGSSRLSSTGSFRGEIDEMRIWSVARTAEQLRDGASCSFLTDPPPTTLRAWWRFNGSGQDDSTYGNNGTLVSPAFFRNTNGALPFCSGHDGDTDGHSDALDNCPLVANIDQADGESDGLGDACDLCPALFGAKQADTDSDGVADACDDCPFLGNTEQIDSDSDGAGNLCDPDPADSFAAVPSDAITLSTTHDQSTGETTLNWNAEPSAGSYEVYRGSLEEIRARFYGTCRNSSDPDTTDTSFLDDEEPDAGELFGYLVVGVGQTGARGLAGLDSEARQRDMRAKDCL